MQREKIFIYGMHALEEALESAPSVIQKVFARPQTLSAGILGKLASRKIPVGELGERESRSVPKDAGHQGVIAAIDPGKLMRPFDAFISTLDIASHPSLILLDEIQDPHNVGAVIRSAAAFGVSGVLMPQNNQAQVTGAVAKVSAGMVFRVPLVSIGNVNQTMRTLKERGFWTYGLAMDGATPLGKERFDAPAVFVVGNEGEGIRQKTLELCDVKLGIPMHPRTESLNAAVSAAIVLYEWSRQHPNALS